MVFGRPSSATALVGGGQKSLDSAGQASFFQAFERVRALDQSIIKPRPAPVTLVEANFDPTFLLFGDMLTQSLYDFLSFGGLGPWLAPGESDVRCLQDTMRVSEFGD